MKICPPYLLSPATFRAAGRLLLLGLVVGAWVSVADAANERGATPSHAEPAAIADAEFWRLVTELSEPGGAFARQLMSNEDSAQFVLPALKAAVPPGGVYVGVGSEQNFTYLAALQPSLAFVIDIRRENVLELLMYKALFELSVDRADFLSRLFSRPRPDGLEAASSVTALFAALARAQPDSGLLDRTARDVLGTLASTHHFPLTQADRTTITGMLGEFRAAGADALKGWGDRTNPTYAQLMSAADLDGRQDSFLASEAHYRIVRALEQRNLVVPVVGDFAGDRALSGLARELRARHAVVNVFYVSNVERYLFEQGEHGRQFYRNLAALPLDPSSWIIRSVTRDISQRLVIPIPAGPTKWWTFLVPIRDCLAGIANGRIQTYRDLFVTP